MKIYQEMTVQGHKTTQSPMNPKQWLLVLSCGHEKWVTSKSRPKRMKATCEECYREVPDKA